MGVTIHYRFARKQTPEYLLRRVEALAKNLGMQIIHRSWNHIIIHPHEQSEAIELHWHKVKTIRARNKSKWNYDSATINDLGEFIDAKTKNNKKILRKYSIKRLVEELKKDYKTYEALCNFAHPNFYEEDISPFEIGEEQIFSIQSYNSFDKGDFIGNILWNNNLLVETFERIMCYLMDNFPKEKIDESIQRVLDETKELKMILVKDKEDNSDDKKR